MRAYISGYLLISEWWGKQLHWGPTLNWRQQQLFVVHAGKREREREWEMKREKHSEQSMQNEVEKCDNFAKNKLLL